MELVQYLTAAGFVAEGFEPDPYVIPLSAAQISAPSVATLRNITATFQLVVSPFTRYRSDGTKLVLLGEGAGNPDAIGGGQPGEPDTTGGGLPSEDTDTIGGGLPT